MDEIWNKSEGPWCALMQQKKGKSPQGFRPRVPKRVFVINATRPFGHLSCADFDRFLKQQTWITFRMRTHVKKFPISVQGVCRYQNSPKYGTVVRVFVIKLQLKRHKCGRWESFRGLVDMPGMCLLYVSFGGGRTVWGAVSPRKKPKFWRLHYLGWPNRITVGVNSNRNRLPLGTLLYSYIIDSN